MTGLPTGSAELLRIHGDRAPENRARSAAAPLRGGGEGVDRDKLKFAAQEMESFFMYQLLKVMRTTIQKSDVFGDRKKEETYIGMMDMELSKKLTKAGGIGLTPMIMANLDSSLSSPTKFTPKEGAAGPKGPGFPLPRDRDRKTVPAEESQRDGVYREKEFFWTRPLEEGNPSSRFGPRKDPLGGGMKFHSGVDLAAPKGYAVRAARPGEVTFAGRKGGYGNLVEILHPDDTVTRYAHASTLRVRKGDFVVSGQEIAQVGSTGRSTGPHLHFELSQEGRRVDPMEILLRSRK